MDFFARADASTFNPCYDGMGDTQLSCPNSTVHGNFRVERVRMSPHSFGKSHGPESK